MRLTEQQAIALTAARLNADRSYSDIARHTKLSVAAVRHAMARLIERGAIKRAVLVNVSRLGLTEYDLYCAIGVNGREERVAFLTLLRSSPLVSYLVEAGGPYQFLITLAAESPSEVDLFFQHIARQFGAAFVSADLMVCLRVSLFAPKLLAPNLEPAPPVTITAEGNRVEFDALDKKVLSAMTKYPSDSIRTISARLKLSHSTVSYRAAALKEKGVLVEAVWILAAQKLGFQEYRILVSLRGILAEVKEGMFKFCKGHPNVTYLLEYLGPWQFAIGIIAPDTTAPTQIVNQIYDSFGRAIDGTSVCLVLGEKKVELYPR